MNQPVILSKLEQEYLLHIIEAAQQVRNLRQFFLWCQGQLQALLPHQLMVCMQFGPGQALHRVETVHGQLIDDAVLARLCDPQAGLAIQLARHGTSASAFPCMADTRDQAPARAMLPFQEQLAASGFDNVLIDWSGPVNGGATIFALFGLPIRPGARHAYFLSLLMPQLHLALSRLSVDTRGGHTGAPRQAGGRALSARETQVLQWLRAGKRNEEIAQLLGLSALTVKNHLQRMYRVLGVRNRTEAVARSAALRIVPDGQ